VIQSVYGFIVVFILHKDKKTWSVNVISWLILVVVTFLEYVFLISLLIHANNYNLIRTNYGTLRVEYLHTGYQIALLFSMGIVGILIHLCSAVAV
jgi:uncharacterized membrane protein YciS (DUF1049 family)